MTEDRKAQARAWFEALRDRICRVFEDIEDEHRDDVLPAGRFERKPWTRPEGGGGVMSLIDRKSVV